MAVVKRETVGKDSGNLALQIYLYQWLCAYCLVDVLKHKSTT